MSDLTGLLPGQALANIAQRGQDRLTKAQAEVKEMCETLLANTVIEDYEIEIN